MATKSSTLLNAPYDFRICRIFSAVAGPMPGTNCNYSAFAVLMFTGRSGGFFVVAGNVAADRKRARNKKLKRLRTANDRHAMALVLCIKYFSKSITK